jgi:hypothetical protein
MDAKELAKKLIEEGIIAPEFIKSDGQPTTDFLTRLFLILYNYEIKKANHGNN